jgi:hypothetical protein
MAALNYLLAKIGDLNQNEAKIGVYIFISKSMKNH